MSNFFFQDISNYVIWKQLTKKANPLCNTAYKSAQK